MRRYVDYAPTQAWLLPPRLDEEVGEDHWARCIHEWVEKLELAAFEVAYSDDGRPADPP